MLIYTSIKLIFKSLSEHGEDFKIVEEETFRVVSPESEQETFTFVWTDKEGEVFDVVKADDSFRIRSQKTPDETFEIRKLGGDWQYSLVVENGTSREMSDQERTRIADLTRVLQEQGYLE